MSRPLLPTLLRPLLRLPHLPPINPLLPSLRPYSTRPSPISKPYTPLPRPPAPARAPPPPPSPSLRGKNAKRGLGLRKGTDDMDPQEKAQYYLSFLNYGEWAYCEKKGWQGLFVVTEFMWLGVIAYYTYVWVVTSESWFAENPIDYDVERNKRSIEVGLDDMRKEWKAASTKEEKDAIAKRTVERMHTMGLDPDEEE